MTTERFRQAKGQIVATEMLIILVLLSPAWAWTQDQAAGALAAAGCGPANVEFDLKTDKNQHPMGQVESGKALVYIFGDEKRNARVNYIGGPTVKVGVDGTWRGATRYQSYFFFPVDAGEHRLCAGWQSSIARVAKVRTAASFQAEVGKTYYFRIVSERRQEREPAIWIEPLDSAEGALLIASSALGTSRAKH